MEDIAQGLVFAGTLDELKDKGQLLVRGHQRPILLLYDQGRVFALDKPIAQALFRFEPSRVSRTLPTATLGRSGLIQSVQRR